MSTGQILTVAGYAIGSYFGYPQLGAIVGGMVGSAIDASNVEFDVPKVNDLKAPGVQYGSKLYRLYGANRVSGSLAWFSEKRVIPGNEGGKGSEPEGPTPDVAEIDVLYILGIDSDIKTNLRVWRNGEVIWTIHGESSSESLVNSLATTAWKAITFLDGNPAQLPHPVIESSEGIGNCSAYRHRQCILIEGLQLGQSGQMPLLEFEPVTSAVEAPLTFEPLKIYPWVEYPFQGPRQANEGRMLYNNTYSDVDEAVGYQLVGNHGLVGTSEFADKYIGYSSSTNPIANKFVGGATTVDDPEYLNYRYSGDTPDIMTNETLVYPYTLVAWGGYMFLAGATAGDGDTYWTQDAATGNNYLTRVSFTPPEPDADIPALGVYEFINNDGGLFGGAYIFGAQIINMNAIRLPSVPDPDTYAIVTGTFRQLAVPVYEDGVLIQNGVGPVHIPSDPEYADMDYWDEQAALAISANTLLPDAVYPVNTTEAAQLVVQPWIPGTIDLKTIVEAEWVRAENIDYLDAGDLIDIPVRGFSTSGSIRGAYEALANIFHWNMVVNSKACCRLQDSPIRKEIPYAKLGAKFDDADEQPFVPEFKNDEEIVFRVNMTFKSYINDYNNGSESGDRGPTESTIVSNMSTNVVMNPGEAKATCQVIANRAGIEAMTVKIQIDDEYAELEPTDRISVIDRDNTIHTFRIQQDTYGRGVHDMMCCRDDLTTLEAPGITTEVDTRKLDLAVNGSATSTTADAQFADAPIYRDADKNDAGFYSITNSAKPTTLFSSLDGAVYGQEAAFDGATTYGTATTTLGPWDQFNGFDEVHSVTVDAGEDSTFSSSTEEAMLADLTINNALVGVHGKWEAIRYRDAVLQSPGIWKFTGLLRAQRGTAHNTDNHIASETFIHVELANVRRVTNDASEIGTEEYYKVVPSGSLLSSAVSTKFTNQAVGLKPFAPVDLQVVETPGGPRLQWHRQDRAASRLFQTSGTPMSETIEQYEVDLLDASNVVVDTIVVTEPEAPLVADGAINYSWQITNDVADPIIEFSSETICGRKQGSAGGVFRLDSDHGRIDFKPAPMSAYQSAISGIVGLGANVYYTFYDGSNPSYLYKSAATNLQTILATYTASAAADLQAGPVTDGTHIFAGQFYSNNLKKLDTTLAVVATYTIGGGCKQLQYTPDGKIWCKVAGALKYLDIAGGTVTSYTLIDASTLLAFHVEGTLLFALHATGNLKVYVLATGIELYSYTAGFSSFGQKQLVPCFSGQLAVASSIGDLGSFARLLDLTTGLETEQVAIPRIWMLAGGSATTLYATVQTEDSSFRTYAYEASTAGAVVKARVQQMSSVVGRGYPAILEL